MASATHFSQYGMHPGFAMEDKAIANLPKTTGKSLDAWIDLLAHEGPESEKERAAWLKANHGIGTNTAAWIAGRSVGNVSYRESYDPIRNVEAMYSGAKEALRPLHERLIQSGLSLGPDVNVVACATIVPLYRRHVFAQIKPTTQTRIDLGFALKETPAAGRLIETGGYRKGDRITHRIEIRTLADVDDEVQFWLRSSYDADVPAR